MKTWRITGTHDGEDFTADLVVDADGDVIEAEHPLHQLVGLSWSDARSYCIAQDWHGDREPSHLSGAGLKRRGWTDGQIKTYLPNPDTTEPNPITQVATRCGSTRFTKSKRSRKPTISEPTKK